MKLSAFTASIAALAAAAGMTNAAYPTMSASKIKSYALWGWGPHERDTNVDLVILDGDIESASTIKSLRNKGVFVTCYLSAGTLENWRDDYSKFISATSGDLARKYKGFGGSETWFDVTRWEELKKPMTDRMTRYKNKGCQALEFDNIDCYNNMCVPGASRDTLMKKQVEYVKWLADKAHSLGMAVGMKNSQELIPKVGNKMSFMINEECQSYSECGLYKSSTSKNKLVLGVEYDDNNGKVCSEAKKHKMLTKYKKGGKWYNCF